MYRKYKVIILQEAQEDIRNIILYIASDLGSPLAALHLNEGFYEKIKSLADMPKRIRKINKEPWKSKGIRKLIFKNYFIYFIISDKDNSVKINAVIYTGRDQKKHIRQNAI